MKKFVEINNEYLQFKINTELLLDNVCYFPLVNSNCFIINEEVYFDESEFNNSIFIAVLKDTSILSSLFIPDYLEILYIKEDSKSILFIFEVENATGKEFLNAYSYLMEYSFEIL